MEYNFYDLINHFIILDLKCADFAYFDDEHLHNKANCVLAYCFLNHRLGISAVILSLANILNGEIAVFSSYKKKEMLPFGKIADFLLFKMESELISVEQFTGLNDFLDEYTSAIEGVLESRKLTSIDHLRNPLHPDLIEVSILKKGNSVGNVDVLIEDYDAEYKTLYCNTINSPENVDCILPGMVYPLLLQESQDGKAYVYFDITEPKSPTEMLKDIYGEDNEMFNEDDDDDSSLIELEMLIEAFREDPDETKYEFIVDILKDVKLFLPCIVDMSIEDIDKCDAMINLIKEDDKQFMKYLKGKDGIFLQPKLMNMDGEKTILPLFTNEEEIEEIDVLFTPIPISIYEVIEYVKSENNQDIVGIVINPTSEPFVLDKEMFYMLND